MMTLRLAAANVRKSWRDYAIYFVTLTFAVTLFYAFNTVDAQVAMLPQQREVVQALGRIINYATWVLVVILGFLMVYANNYLVRRRTKELALYQVLGMRRRNVAAILTAETLLSSLGALAAGLGLGVLTSQFLVFVTGRIMQETVENYRFVFSGRAFAFTIATFLAIFAVTLVLNLVTLRRLTLIELMQAGKANQVTRTRSPWISAALFLAGAGLIGWAYWRLMCDGYPLLSAVTSGTSGDPEGWKRFALTTAMVFAGTYILFFSFGGMLLHFARTSRRTYWRGLNMFTVRELASRVRTSAASMATISLVIFLMLGVVTSSFGLATTLNDALEKSAPHDLTFTVFGSDPRPDNAYAALETAGFVPDASLEGDAGADAGARASAAGAYRPDSAFRPAPGEPVQGTVAGHRARWAVEPMWNSSYAAVNPEEGQAASTSGSQGSGSTIPKLSDVINASGVAPIVIGGTDLTQTYRQSLDIVGVSDYNAHRALAGLDPLEVPDGTFAASFSSGFDEVRDAWVRLIESGTPLTVLGHELVPAGKPEAALDESAAALSLNAALADNMGTLIVPDSLVADLRETDELLYSTPVTVDFEEDLSLQENRELASAIWEQLEDMGEATDGAWQSVLPPSSRATLIPEVVGLTGTVTYLAVYVGLVLAMASAAILAIKMLAQAADAAPRYRRLSELGCPRAMADRSLAVQVGAFFVLPLAVAAVHAFVAVREFSEIIKILLPFSIAHAAVTTGLFVAAIYGLYYVLTLLAARTVLAQR